MGKIICIDIDDTIARPKTPYQDDWFKPTAESYEKLAVVYLACDLIVGAKARIDDLYGKGFKIILWTARTSMFKTLTINWLKMNGIKYHEIYFDKPRADFYIDDKAIGFTNWEDVYKKIW
jgi:uncharacterized HAD superfamily protein